MAQRMINNQQNTAESNVYVDCLMGKNVSGPALLPVNASREYSVRAAKRGVGALEGIVTLTSAGTGKS